MANSAYKHITGMDTVTDLLQQLPVEVQQSILVTAVKQSAVPIEKWEKRFAKRSERTGALRDSITTKVKKYGAKAVAIVGPSRDYYRGGKKLSAKGGFVKGAKGAQRPSNYAHLIEFGHHAVKPRKGTSLRKRTATTTGWVPAKPFVRPAALAAAPEAALAFTEGMDRGITKTRDRLIRSGQHAA